jgi:hypothetical protein
MKKIILAALVGGIIVFIWSAIAHMATPLGTMGISNLPNEDAVMASLRANVPDSGMYWFPGERPDHKEWEAKMKEGPSGLLFYTAGGGPMMHPKQLISELLTNIVAAFIAASIVALIFAPYAKRVGVIVMMGVFGWVSLLLSYWIWYHFPTAYVLGEMVTEVVGWFLAGLAIAKIVPPRVAA